MAMSNPRFNMEGSAPQSSRLGSRAGELEPVPPSSSQKPPSSGFNRQALRASAPIPPPPRYLLRYWGTGGALFLLMLRNLLLTLLTLGIYRAWAKTNQRKYVWQNIEFHGQRLSYLGTGRELFVGYLKLVGCYIVLFGVPAALGTVSKPLGIGLQVTSAVVVLALIPFAIYWSRAYLLSRTAWRGVRFGLRPGARAFAKTCVAGYLLSVLTLGLYSPIWLNRMHTILTNNTALGSQHFKYFGDDWEVWRLSLKGWFLSLLTLGIYYPWYRAALARYRVENTFFSTSRGQLQLTGGELLGLFLLYALGTTLTLGLAFPWIASHLLGFIFERTRFEGPIEFAKIERCETVGNATADGLADFMDVGGF